MKRYFFLTTLITTFLSYSAESYDPYKEKIGKTALAFFQKNAEKQHIIYTSHNTETTMYLIAEEQNHFQKICTKKHILFELASNNSCTIAFPSLFRALKACDVHLCFAHKNYVQELLSAQDSHNNDLVTKTIAHIAKKNISA